MLIKPISEKQIHILLFVVSGFYTATQNHVCTYGMKVEAKTTQGTEGAMGGVGRICSMNNIPSIHLCGESLCGMIPCTLNMHSGNF